MFSAHFVGNRQIARNVLAFPRPWLGHVWPSALIGEQSQNGSFGSLRFRMILVLIGLALGPWSVPASGQESPTEDQESRAKPVPAEVATDFISAIDLLPESLAGLARVPNVQDFCDASKQTRLGQLLSDPLMKPFLEDQRDRAKDYFESINNKVGIKLQDLHDIASGEAAIAWLPFDGDIRRPYSLALLADIRQRKTEATAAMDKVDADLKTGGWTRTDSIHGGHSIRLYDTEPKPGQLKLQQIAIHFDDERLIAADRLSVVTGLLDAIAKKSVVKSIGQSDDFKRVMAKLPDTQETTKQGGGIRTIQWFARPFSMGRILRQAMEIDRGNDVKILDLLERQGFGAILAAGGNVSFNGNKFDVLHHGFVLAPPTVDGEDRYAKAAKMLQFLNKDVQPIPGWVHDNAATFSRLNINVEKCFWASETLVDDAVNDKIFRSMIEGIKEDEDGPQIDIEKEILPNLDDEILFLTDHVQPIDLGCQRLLVAIRVKNAEALGKAVRRVMEFESDAKLIENKNGTEIYQVQRSEDGEEDLDREVFGDFEDTEDEKSEDEEKPLLNQWAVAVTTDGPNSYLMFASHVELLADTVNRMAANLKGLDDLEEVKAIESSIKDLGGDQIAFSRLMRTRLSLRARYELLRAGKLKNSDSILSSLYRRIAEDSGRDPKNVSLDASKLPAIEQIEKYLPNGGSFVETTQEGWSMTGFFLK
jgi:hypothetical protein